MLKMNNDDRKNIVLVYACDRSGCSHVRLRYFADYFNANEQYGVQYIISPIFTFDPNILACTKAIIWQKPAAKQHLSILQRYKALQQKFGYNLVYEIDDLFFASPFSESKNAVPDYNPSSIGRNPQIDAEIEECLPQIINMMDLVVTSTDYLRKIMEYKFHASNVITVKNTVPRFLWNYPRRKDLIDDLKKPVVLYSGSPTHYSNPIPPRGPSPAEPKGFSGRPGMLGDWENSWKDWVIKNVNENKIDFVIMGALPYFFEEIKDKIRFVPWGNSYTYPRLAQEINADFQIAPLVSNEFNKSKSALRFYESSICGNVLLGTVFDDSKDSPYEEINPEAKIKLSYSVDQIDEVFWKLCKKDKYHEIRNWQYENLNKSGLILESDKALDSFLKISDNTMNHRDDL